MMRNRKPLAVAVAAVLKASEVRAHLSEVLESVRHTTRDVLICRSGLTPVAKLTLAAPSSGTRPMRVGVEAARQGYSELMEMVTTMGARFEFGSKGGQPVYLVRVPDHRNRWAQRWREHRATHRESAPEAPAEDVAEALAQEFQSNLAKRAESLQRRVDKVLKLEMDRLLEDAQAQFDAARVQVRSARAPRRAVDEEES